MFKKNFVISNQVARQNAKNDMEKKFYKLMNNSNFGYNCRNNFNNCLLAPVIDELEEMSYIHKHQSVFDPSVKDFFSTTLLEKQINDEFDNKISQLDALGDFYDVRKNPIELEKRTIGLYQQYEKCKEKNPQKRQTKRGRSINSRFRE